VPRRYTTVLANEAVSVPWCFVTSEWRLSFRCVVPGRYEVEPNLKANAIRRNVRIDRSRREFLTLLILSQSYGNSLPQSRQAT
jgi:hypothetical protein